MPAFFRPFQAALSFLTRLVPPPPQVNEALLAASVRWYPVAGLVVGLLSVLPVWALRESAHWLLLGWLYVFASLWITRGLHWDGVADVADAWGSGKHGKEFHDILKDSRIGAFGVMALVMGLVGQMLLAGINAVNGALLPLILAPVAGRIAVVLLAGASRPHPDSVLGCLTVKGATTRLTCACALALPLLFWVTSGFFPALRLTIACLLLLSWLRYVAMREGGVNGDFMGTSIMAVELSALGACLW